MKLRSDIDIDLPNRNLLLEIIDHTPAAMLKTKPKKKHASGIYISPVPIDPITNICSVDYKEMDKRGYFKLDLLNVHVYEHVKDEAHLIQLMREPNWDKLKDREFVENVIHLANHYNSIMAMPEPINSIPRLAMFLAIIRPAKWHLIGEPWDVISQTVWNRDENGGYSFRKSHSLAYSHLVVVHANLLDEHFQKTGSYDLGQLLP
jgi:hypothetical protein